MRVRLSTVPDSELAKAVATFNTRYGEMERVLWCLSQHCRDPLLAREPAPVVESLIWTIKSWWGVQGVRTETRAAMAQALADMDWSEELFAPAEPWIDGSPEFATGLVASLVERSRTLGVPRREYSLASKALHWLLPWQVPVYDSFVRVSLGIPDGWDHPDAYQRIARELFDQARKTMAVNPKWVGELEPRSPLRAFDKCLWWFGGGDSGTAMEVAKPWRVVDSLGLTRL